MHNKGMDIYCTLPFLSSFLGHKNIYASERYLKLSQECFKNLCSEKLNNIFPEVNEL